MIAVSTSHAIAIKHFFIIIVQCLILNLILLNRIVRISFKGANLLKERIIIKAVRGGR